MKFDIGDKVKSVINGKTYVVLDEKESFLKSFLDFFRGGTPDVLLKREDGTIGSLYSGELEKI